MVLFLGRITFQKGPEHFIDAAAKVLPHVPNASFVMAGAGDLLPRMRDRVRQLGLEPHFHFPGFLRGPEVEQMFSTADLYVMPSVSEPFGISALEAISFDTPVIISRQSGVAEVLRNALKVDFWDVDRLAELIIGVLRHQEVRSELVQRAREEVRLLRWDAAAIRSLSVYRGLLQTT
jgi:glycosyltransferase involved in cell wall biosynthesis